MDVVGMPRMAGTGLERAQLGDRRRVGRLTKVTEQILKHPAGSLPQKMEDPAGLMGLYRLLSAPQVTHQALLAPHRELTLSRMAQHPGVVLILHDSSDFDFTHCSALAEDLGQIGNGGGCGFIAHHTLAITPQREVVGLINQVLHRRRRVKKGETAKHKRQAPDRESRLWLKGAAACGEAPAGCTWIDIADRGSDTYEFLSYEHAHHRKYVIRSAKSRKLDGEDHLGCDRIHQKLHEYARDLPVLGTRSVEVSRQADKKGRKSRVAQVSVSAGPITLVAPQYCRGEHPDVPLETWVIVVREIDPPPGASALEWILLSNLPAQNFEAACQLIDFYACRVVIEEYHKGLKTGLSIESLKFEHVDRLEPAIALLSVIGTLLLQLRAAARAADADQVQARTIVPLIYVQIVGAKIYKQVRNDLSVRQFLLGVARLGGHLGRKNDGFPGWLTLWRGWNDLQLMAQGAQLLRPSG
jgi:hypothetical protein